ncbi:rod shape-determining protein RodA [Elizabethkingia meningoseptica]|uniref:rod shape-determining protein RodA n=1 Tax=Elizabethkingia meningoseptica TaxID=238 RepID=UPI000332D0CA|nr:rod shape-determining protein RodA [Elizabethkingia meningoseptica]AQX04404.1 rod shape-determining protein RodA [Elizabethkingia meningoseptica]AQX46445.1 rod shape-determining protein RodA [Elizabethkingia meningoseptica]EJK5328662.1 rod shape-determining protein RodA [Elizabethkingia meningoseptica]EOR31601.1 Rod shape-determining protein rodA [Elizabethkingia meningoseptica ATCC 13253 = NBRC 12535]KUY18961.1 rod shape-determining protein RodA [Elizabethkingia meningoseptica]
MKWYEGIDKLGLGLYFVLCIFAIANINSVDSTLGQKQLIFFGISVFVGIFIFFTRNKFFENMASIIYVGGVLLLIGLFPFGKEILGQKNWYKFGSFTMQPVEFAKIGTALMLANYVAGPDFNIKNKKSLWTALAIIAVPAVVVLAIPDVGSLLVFGAFFIALYREGLSGWLFGLGFLFAAVFLVSLAIDPIYIVIAILVIAGGLIFFNYSRMSWNIISIGSIAGSILVLCGLAMASPKILEKLPKHQRERIEVLYKGEKMFRDTSGYNLLYSKTAIGSGGLWGKGYKEGSVTQGKFVPEQQTDYIFCTVGEEWGFAGSAALIICYVLYIGRIYYLAERQKSTFNRVFGYCFASILLLHFCINLGMVMGLFPTVGIPMPYFSYGGSSLLAFSIMTFIFFKLNYADRNSLV